MKKMNYALLLLLSILYLQIGYAQNPKQIDSIQHLIATTTNDSVKIDALNKMAWHYIFNDAKKVNEFLKKSEKIAIKSNNHYGYNEIVNIKGIFMDIKGNADSAKYFFQKAYQLSKKNNFKTIEVRTVNNLGMFHWNTGKFKEALDYFFKALKINESLPKEKQIKFSILYNNIGLIYQEMHLNYKALEYHKKAYELRKRDNQKKDQASSLNNIGICYHSLGQNKTAIATYKKGLVVAKESQNEIDYYKLLENTGNALQSDGQFKASIPYYIQVLNHPPTVTLNPKTYVGVYTGLVAAYNEIKQPNEALKYAEKGIEVIQKHPDLESFIYSLYQYTAQSHYMLGNIKEGDRFNTFFIENVKATFSEENAKSIADLEIKFETAEKEKLLAENKAALLKSQIQTKKKNFILITVSVLAFFIALVGFLIYRQQNLKNKQQKQEFSLKSAISQIETQNKLQEQRLAISRDLHDNIGAQLTFIISSVDNIEYAFDIKNEKLDYKLKSISNFTKATIIELRDTIWAMNSNEITFEDLHARVLNFIEKAKEAQGKIDFKFLIDKELHQLKLTSIVGMNVYRTIQEAVNNAMKYAKASKINIEVKSIQNKIRIEIQDNGMGFELENIEIGNGLHNMRKRIEDIDGEFSIVSEASKGTKITAIIDKIIIDDQDSNRR